MKKPAHRKMMAVVMVMLMISALWPAATAWAIEIKVLSRPNVKDGTVASLGMVFVEFEAGRIKKGDSLVISLPDGFEFRSHLSPNFTKIMEDGFEEWMANEYLYIKNTGVDKAYVPGVVFDPVKKRPVPVKTGIELPINKPINNRVNYLAVPTTVNGEENGAWIHGDWIMDMDTTTHQVYGMHWDNTVDDDPDDSVPILVTQLNEREVKLDVMDDPAPGRNVIAYAHPGAVWIKSGHKGPVLVKFTASPGSGFISGVEAVAMVTGEVVTVEAVDIPSFTDNTADSKPVKLRIKEDVGGTLKDDGESLKFTLPNGFEWDRTGFDVGNVWDGATLSGGHGDLAAYWKATAKFEKDKLILPIPSGSETDRAACVDITVNINLSDSSQAKPGEIKARVDGKSDVDPSEVTVAKYGEYGSGSEVSDAPTVFAGKLEQKIGKVVLKETAPGSLVAGRTVTLTLPANARWGKIDSSDSDNGVDLVFKGFPGTDGRTAKWEIDGKSDSEEATLELEDMEVSLEPGTTGDLKVQAGGTAGIQGEIQVAKVQDPVTIAAGSTPQVRVGEITEAGDLTITETSAGAIEDDKSMILDLPQGVRFVSTPKVEVVEGDLKIDADSVKTLKDGEEDDNQVSIDIDSDSGTASKIKVSGIKYIVDRTVPVGDIFVKVKGAAVSSVNDPVEVNDYYLDKSNDATAYDQDVLIEGETAFHLEKSMVFPKSTSIAKVANATTATPAPSEVKVSASFVIGQTKFTVNGVEQAMDVAPYIKNDRTFLPVRFVGYALGLKDSEIIWDGQKATLLKGNKVVQIAPDQAQLVINGTPLEIDAAPEITDGRLMLPVRWVGQSLGAQVEWDPETQTVNLKQ